MECTIKAALARLCTGTKILIPNSVRPTLISTSIVLKIWLWILVWIVTGSSNAVFTPSVIEDLLVFVLRNAEVMVIIWLMEWIERSRFPAVMRAICPREEACTSRLVELVEVLVVHPLDCVTLCLAGVASSAGAAAASPPPWSPPRSCDACAAL